MVEDFTSPHLQATYDVQLSARDVAPFVTEASRAAGIVHLSGSVVYEDHVHQDVFEAVHLAGELRAPVLRVRTYGGSTEIRDLRATYNLDRGNLEIQNVRAQAVGGSLNGNLSIRGFPNTSSGRLQVRLRGISLEGLEAAAPQYSLPQAYLTGKISGDARASWGPTLADLIAHVDASMEGAFGQKPPAPLSGAVHCDYSAKRHEIELRQSYLRAPSASVILDGKVSRYSQLKVHAQSNNLHELEMLVASFKTALSREPPPKLNLYGTASFEGFVEGSVTEPHAQGRLEARDLRVQGSWLKLLRAHVKADPSLVELTDAYVEAAPQGKINFTLRVGLEEWAYTPASPIKLVGSVSRISLAEVERLMNRADKISGILSASVSLHGSQLNPIGQGEITVVNGEILSEPVQRIFLKFQGDGDAVRASMQVNLLAGAAQAQMTLNPKTKEYEAQIGASDIRLERLETVKQRRLSLAGVLSLDARGHGVISSPEITAETRISQLRLGEYPIPALTLAAHIHDRVAEMTLKTDLVQAPVEGHGTVNVDPPYVADLRLDIPRFPYKPLLALYARALGHELHGEAELHASVHGPLENAALLEGHLDVPVLTASFQQLELGATHPVRVDFRDGVLTLRNASFSGTGTQVQVEAAVPISNPASAAYSVKGAMDLSLLRMVEPGLSGEGRIEIDLDSRRQAEGSDLVGDVRIVSASVYGNDLPLRLDEGNGVLSVSRSRVEIKSLQGQVGGGTITVRGGVTLRPAVRFDLGLSGSGIRLRYPQGVRSILKPDLTLAGDRNEATLSGNIAVQGLSLTRDFDMANLLNEFSEGEPVASAGGFEHLRLNVTLQSHVDITSREVSLQGNTNLRVVGTAAEPVILGRAELNGGDLFLGGNRYVLQSGSIDFVNPFRTEAVVNASVKTQVDQYDISLNLRGPMENLTTTYSSDPPLPSADIFNLLAFGHTNTEALGTTLTPSTLGAQSALVQGLGSAVSGRIQKFAGLSYFSIDPTLGGSNQNAGARVVIQERVTRDLVVTYSTDVTSTQRQAIQLEYRFNPRWSVSGVRDQNGGFGATLTFRKSF
jgi:translocation and assembly module TamB